MFNFFKSFGCKHKSVAYKFIDELQKDGTYKRRTIWKCSKCGKIM